MKEFKFSLIICTLGNRIDDFRKLIKSLESQTYKRFELVVVSQGSHDRIKKILSETFLDFKFLKSQRKGLSLNRNLGLDMAIGDIITISDDDCWYPSNALHQIIDHFCSNCSVDVLTFQIYDSINNVFYKKYSERSREYGIYDVGKCSSIEIFFRKSSKNSDVKFDEHFGLGATYPSGEENIFLADLLKAGNRILYLPKVVVYHKAKEITPQKFSLLKMETSYFMFKRIFKFPKNIFIYFLFYFKHFNKIDNKLKSFFIFNKI